MPGSKPWRFEVTIFENSSAVKSCLVTEHSNWLENHANSRAWFYADPSCIVTDVINVTTWTVAQIHLTVAFL